MTLKKAYEEDQNDRKLDWKDKVVLAKVVNRDKERLAFVHKVLKSTKSLSSEEKYYAAMLLQHGDTSNDYLQANKLCDQSKTEGYEPAKWLYAASLDRYLMALGKPQKYGTQFKLVDNIWVVWDFDKTTTDKERANLNVPPLASQLHRAKNMNKRG